MDKDKSLMILKDYLYQKFIEWQGVNKGRMTYRNLHITLVSHVSV